MKIYLRLDEESKSEEQKQRRERTYEAARFLRKNGFNCEVRELWTGDNTDLSPASIELLKE